MALNNSVCGLQLNYVMESLQNHSLWSMEFLDLSGKLPTGILNQRLKSLGLYDECLEFKHDSSEVGPIEGQYCTVSYESSLTRSAEVNKTRGFDWTDLGFAVHKKDLKLQSGICAPASCSPEEFKPFLNFILSKADLVATQVICSKIQHISDYFTAWDLIAIPFFLILILAVAASTCYDIKQRKKDENSKNNLVNSISLYTNTEKLLKINTSQKSIECLNGMRTIAAYWVILCHRICLALPDRNIYMSRPRKPDFILLFLRRGGLAVDTFMISAAILMTRSCLTAYKSGKFNLFKFYFHRYMRYGPAIAVALLFLLCFIPHFLVDGPIRNVMDYQAFVCHKYWLQTILLMQTYTNHNDFCMTHLWYLNTDFHLYLVSPVITYILWKLEFKSFLLLGPIAVSIQAIGYFVTVNKIIPESNVYMQAHYRLGQWIIGTLFGFLIFHTENLEEKFKISKKIHSSIWVTTISGCIYFYHDGPLCSIIYSFLIGWTIFTFHHFHSGGIIRWFLSHPLWQPLAKLTLSIYIVHMLYIISMIANVQELAFYKTGWLLHIMAGDIVFCTFFGLVLYLFVEAPATNILNILMKNEKKNLVLEGTDEKGYALLINDIDETLIEK